MTSDWRGVVEERIRSKTRRISKVSGRLVRSRAWGPRVGGRGGQTPPGAVYSEGRPHSQGMVPVLGFLKGRSMVRAEELDLAVGNPDWAWGHATRQVPWWRSVLRASGDVFGCRWRWVGDQGGILQCPGRPRLTLLQP